MLPSAKSSLTKGGLSPKAAAWVLIACFIGGVIGIQVLSRIMHHFMPHHVVDCDHSHDEQDLEPERDHGDHKHFDAESEHAIDGHDMQDHDAAPEMQESMTSYQSSALDDDRDPNSTLRSNGRPERPSLHSSMSSKFSRILSGRKAMCDESGQCYGYANPCGQDCFKKVQARGGTRIGHVIRARQPGLTRSATSPTTAQKMDEMHPLLAGDDEESQLHDNTRAYNNLGSHGVKRQHSDMNGTVSKKSSIRRGSHTHSESHSQSHGHSNEQQHHHHVPQNAFMSIGLQTSIAIALHKLPEGFITYATNHANPKLGFAVFLALFIHNITEGFAMALPLYLAINNRWKAMLVSTVLGGFSQPLGAGVAAIWFHLAGGADAEPGEAVYGGMFAVTGTSIYGIGAIV